MKLFDGFFITSPSGILLCNNYFVQLHLCVFVGKNVSTKYFIRIPIHTPKLEADRRSLAETFVEAVVCA